jgi:hypothetical protein
MCVVTRDQWEPFVWIHGVKVTSPVWCCVMWCHRCGVGWNDGVREWCTALPAIQVFHVRLLDVSSTDACHTMHLPATGTCAHAGALLYIVQSEHTPSGPTLLGCSVTFKCSSPRKCCANCCTTPLSSPHSLPAAAVLHSIAKPPYHLVVLGTRNK